MMRATLTARHRALLILSFGLLLLGAREACAATAATTSAAAGATAPRGDRAFIVGGDISTLPELEKAGAVYRDNGRPADAIAILRGRGFNLFRVRLFVNPNPNYAATGGATQDLAYVRALAKRIKQSGAALMLDFHYSDTWADPAKQYKPAAWKDLDFDALERKVHDYTAEVLRDLRQDGIVPEMVQVGNEIASGMIWPDGKVSGAKPPDDARQWERFARLIKAGVKAVRAAQTDGPPIRVMLHIHGGGRAGLPKWFFEKLRPHDVDFDVVGLSFYPAWDDTLDALKQNMADLVQGWGKDVLIAEASYPWQTLPDVQKPALTWPQTPQGQRQFVQEMVAALRAVPDGRGIGFVWWYPEATPVRGLRVWREGREGLFDAEGNPQPSLDLFKPDQPATQAADAPGASPK